MNHLTYLRKLVKSRLKASKKDGFFAHGETRKKAIKDVQFKIVSEKLAKEPINADTLVTVNHYRIITGACELGVRYFLEQNNIEFIIKDNSIIEKEPIRADELLILLEKTDAYGLENFKKLINF